MAERKIEGGRPQVGIEEERGAQRLHRGAAARAYRDVVAAARRPQRFSTGALDQLGVWKADILELARARAEQRR